MIFTNAGTHPTENYLFSLKARNIKLIEEWTPNETNSVFLYDRHDRAVRGVKFDTFLTPEQWEYFRVNHTSRIVIAYPDDYLNKVDIDRFAEGLLKNNADNDRVLFVAMDENYAEFLRTGLELRGVYNPECTSINTLQKKIPPRYGKKPETDYKFSFLSRNYYPWRLQFALEMVSTGAIKNTNYSFHKYMPYGETREEKLEDLIVSAKEFKLYDDTSAEWMKGIPYDIGHKHNKFSAVTYDVIDSADIHVVIESHFDPYLFHIYSTAADTYTKKEIAPGFLTEKTWKAIASKKPFFMVATPYTLQDLRKLGFYTFGAYIDESYDLIEDNDKRMKAISAEIDRINNLKEPDYIELVHNLNAIAYQNFVKYEKKWSSKINFDKYPFLIDIIGSII